MPNSSLWFFHLPTEESVFYALALECNYSATPEMCSFGKSVSNSSSGMYSQPSWCCSGLRRQLLLIRVYLPKLGLKKLQLARLPAYQRSSESPYYICSLEKPLAFSSFPAVIQDGILIHKVLRGLSRLVCLYNKF